MKEIDDVQKPILEYLKRREILHARLNAGRKGGVRLCPAGWPDIIAFANGMTYAIECKRPGEVPTPEQDEVLQKMVHAGNVVAVVATSVNDVILCFEMAEQRKW